MSGKGDKRRPGSGYSEGYDRIYGKRCLKHPRVKLPCPACKYMKEIKDKCTSQSS